MVKQGSVPGGQVVSLEHFNEVTAMQYPVETTFPSFVVHSQQEGAPECLFKGLPDLIGAVYSYNIPDHLFAFVAKGFYFRQIFSK